MNDKTPAFTASMSDAAVKAKTGRDWKAWFALLDKKGAAGLDHKGVVKVVAAHLENSSWWAQMVAVEYERARGNRAKHETAAGFSVSISKTLKAPLARVFSATADAAIRKAWFPKGAFAKSSDTKDKYFRGSWGKNGARLEINFTAKGAGKSQINVQVNKMAKKTDVEAERAAWKKALEKLEILLQ